MEAAVETEICAALYNFAADYIVLDMVRRNLFPETGKKRIAAGAAAGSVTYVCCYLLKEKMPSVLYISGSLLIVSLLLCLIFKIRSARSFGRTAATLLICLFVLGGLVYFFSGKGAGGQIHFGESLAVMAGGSGAFWLFRSQKKKEERRKENLYDVWIFRKGKRASCRGLYDSGNLLKSAINGRGVFVTDRQTADALLAPEEKIIFSRIYALKNREEEKAVWNALAGNLCSGIYFLRYHSVGKEGGLLPGIAAERVLVKKDGKVLADTGGILAVSREKLSLKEQFSVLLPADIFLNE